MAGCVTPASTPLLHVLQAMATFLYATRTLNVPSFAFPWLQLVSDKRFMPKLLMAPGHRGWPAYLQLIISQVGGVLGWKVNRREGRAGRQPRGCRYRCWLCSNAHAESLCLVPDGAQPSACLAVHPLQL